MTSLARFLREMFATPDAPASAYVWAAALMGHWAIGAGLTMLLVALLGPRSWLAAIVVSLVYAAAWEGAQIVFAGSAVWDAILDWVAVTLGALCGAAAWEHRRRLIAAIVGTVLLIVTAGVGKRR